MHNPTCHCSECDAPTQPDTKSMFCAVCEITSEFALDDDPERCSCGSAYDVAQYKSEYSEDLQKAIDANEAQRDDAAWARWEQRARENA